MSVSAFAVGDRVAYTAAFLRSIGDYSSESASHRGAVTRIDGAPLIEVQWEGGKKQLVNTNNLILADRIHLEPP